MADPTEMAKPSDTLWHVILFYKYHPLSPDEDVTKKYRDALANLCTSLALTGRILVGCSRSEGINGTLAGNHHNVRAFTLALIGEESGVNDDPWNDLSPIHFNAVKEFWKQSAIFFQSIGESPLTLLPEDFKWSSASQRDPIFPDLNIKLVKELIGSGGTMSTISFQETSKGYLTPTEWHAALKNTDEDTVLIDCRNTKEYEIGHFPDAIDPTTTTFSQFPKWVKDNQHLLAKKKVLMYCTGGIRCEKVNIQNDFPTEWLQSLVELWLTNFPLSAGFGIH
jgi:predicted sulfurtransferase